MEDYLMNTRDQYYMEGGMRVYNLKEVTVTAKRERPSSKSIYTGGINTYTVEEDRLQGYGQTAFDAATRLPSVTIMNGSEIHIRNNPEPAAIVIDDIVYDDGTYENKIIMFKKAAHILGLEVSDCLIIEDSLSGIENAYKAGCRNIIVIDSANKKDEYQKLPGVTKVIDTFKEI